MSVKLFSCDIHFNSFQRPKNDGGFQPVCSKGNSTLLPKTNKDGCPSSMSIDKDIYIAAGLSAGGKLPNGNLVDGSWGHAPFGCSVTSHGDVHYNSNINGIDNGDFALLCHEEL